MTSIYFKEKSLIKSLAPIWRSFINISYKINPKITLEKVEKLISQTRSLKDYSFNKVTPTQSFYIDCLEGDIFVHEFLQSDPAVILVHGWADTSLRFESLIENLLKKNLSVYVFDHVGCGKSHASKSNLMNYVEGLEKVYKYAESKKEVLGVVTHSMGSVALLNLNTEKIIGKRLVLIAAPTKYFENLFETLEKTGVPKKVFKALLDKVSKKHHRDWTKMGPYENRDKLKSSNTLFIHDPEDRFCSYTNLQDYLKGSQLQLITTKGLGHHRIMKDPEVISKTISWLINSET